MTDGIRPHGASRAERAASPRPPRFPAGVILFTAAWLVAAVVLAFGRGNSEFLLYIGVLLVLIAAVALVHRRVDLSSGALVCLSVWGLLHMAGGLVPVPASWPVHGEQAVLYSLWLVPGCVKYDHVVHAYGFGITTWVCFQALAHLAPTVRPTAGPLVLCAAAGLGFGALNEIVEFAATLLVPETNVGGYFNTGWDLVSNLLGATVAGCVLGWVGRRGRGAARSLPPSGRGT